MISYIASLKSVDCSNVIHNNKWATVFLLHVYSCFGGVESIGLCSFGNVTHWGSDRNTAFDEGFAFLLVQNLELQITAALPRVLWHGPYYVIWGCVCGVAMFLVDQINVSLSGRSKCGDWSCTIKHLRAWCPAAERKRERHCRQELLLQAEGDLPWWGRWRF